MTVRSSRAPTTNSAWRGLNSKIVQVGNVPRTTVQAICPNMDGVIGVYQDLPYNHLTNFARSMRRAIP
jgi:hypothetical protein